MNTSALQSICGFFFVIFSKIVYFGDEKISQKDNEKISYN
jgi:hypothetical protein